MMDLLAKKTFRYERKFVIPYLTKQEAEVAIMDNPFLFNEIFYERKINNFYFDSLGMHSYFDNVLGQTDRTKVRVRWYGDPSVVRKPTLELKIKRGLLGTKISHPLPSFPLDGLSLDMMKEVFSEANLPDWLEEKLQYQRFSLYNQYSRKYFLSACGKFRVTLDFDLRYAGVIQQNPLTLSEEVSEPYVIMEVKYDKDADAEDVTTHFPFRMTKSSKYVKGIDFFRGE